MKVVYVLAGTSIILHFNGSMLPYIWTQTNEELAMHIETTQHVKKFVLTGGPCSGKTECLLFLQKHLGARGYAVYCVPEAATMLISLGIMPWTHSDFQHRVINLQLKLEFMQEESAKRAGNEKAIILCDRGIADNLAYMQSKKNFAWWLRPFGLSIVAARDARYDAVFHLVTAANGAEHAYGNATNACRYESSAEARATDLKTQNAWVGAPHLRVIDNSTDFEGKKQRLFAEVLLALGDPLPLEIERRFLLAKHVMVPRIIHHETVNIEQIYLKTQTEGVSRRIRRRGRDGDSVCYLTEKASQGNGINEEIECRITAQHYGFLRSEAYDPQFQTIQKRRTCFLFEGQYFELDTFASAHQCAQILEIELTHPAQDVILPSFIGAYTEVTGNHAYSNRELARKSRI